MSYFRATKDGRMYRSTVKNIDYRKADILLDFSFSDVIKDEVKVMDGARWNPDTKGWSVKNSQRNHFAIETLLKGPEVTYARWDAPLQLLIPTRDIAYGHQTGIMSHFFQRGQAIAGAEMGCGKTLSVIMLLEYLKILLGSYPCWYVAPKTALMSVKMDFAKWKANYYPEFMTLHEMVRRATAGGQCPKVFIIDESSRVKSPDAKQSQAAQHIADAMRVMYGTECWVLLMSGSPAPKSPLDWWKQCEIARPGFLREGNINKFKNRVALVQKMTGESGVAYPKIITFRDSTEKCNICGKLQSAEVHTNDPKVLATYTAGSTIEHQLHRFAPMMDEVTKLYARMDGLVQVTLKKNCLDLPEKVYQVRRLKPSTYMKSLAKMLTKSVPGAAQVMGALRELSDGFQYSEELSHVEPCEHCVDKTTGLPTGKTISVDMGDEGIEVSKETKCIHCAGHKGFKRYKQIVTEVDTPKEEALLDILEEKAEDGRLIVFAAFQGAVDRCCKAAVKAGWKFIRRDGRGWYSNLGIDTNPTLCRTHTPEEMIRIFQREQGDFDKVVWIAHPKSSGMGVTLTASDTIVYYSNSFDAEDRLQSEDRNHRPGCRGANIIDFEHLPIDKFVRENLKNKRELQSITMGEVLKAMETEDD